AQLSLPMLPRTRDPHRDLRMGSSTAIQAIATSGHRQDRYRMSALIESRRLNALRRRCRFFARSDGARPTMILVPSLTPAISPDTAQRRPHDTPHGNSPSRPQPSYRAAFPTALSEQLAN